MKNTNGRRLRKSSSNSSNSISDIDIEEFLKPKTSKTDKLCSIINYVSLVPTLIYNTYWIYVLISDTRLGHIIDNINQSDEICVNLSSSMSIILTWVIISTIKAFTFLLLSKLVCGSENDCNVLCVVIKGITSFIPSVYFYYKFSYLSDITQIISDSPCELLYSYVNLFFSFEKAYIYFFLFLLFLVPFGAILTIFKELWKGRKYHVKNQ